MLSERDDQYVIENDLVLIRLFGRNNRFLREAQKRNREHDGEEGSGGEGVDSEADREANEAYMSDTSELGDIHLEEIPHGEEHD